VNKCEEHREDNGEENELGHEKEQGFANYFSLKQLIILGPNPNSHRDFEFFFKMIM